MSEIIASTYELIEKIGAGGGGNVYLANHLRLGKKVVLKADKREITTRPELLRREVDVLKDLSHSHIPQVYDFFVENDTVYTVMAYIEGESLDKPLKRGEKYPQPQVVKWAQQLLEALSYLHSPIHGTPPRGYVHSDIKPANLMRTPDNNICLIDFNIALALGEENVIGCSIGYASPEHYGLDFSSDGYNTSSHSRTWTRRQISKVPDKNEAAKTVVMEEKSGEDTVTMSNTVTEKLSAPEDADRGSTAGRKSDMPSDPAKMRTIVSDIRSDIYSVGATLYHLLSGRRPARNAKEVIPLSEAEFSPLIVAIISKAMNPNPDLRYQTAEEMLYDFTHLREMDPRVWRWKRNRRVAGILLSAIFVSGFAASFVGLKRMQATENSLKLAEYSANALAEGDVSNAIDLALQAIPTGKSILEPAVTAQAQKALTDALGVYNLSDGFKALDAIELPSAPFRIVASPEETCFAVVYAYEVAVFDMEQQQKKVTLPAQNSALSDVIFLDESHIVYAGAQGVTAYDLNIQSILWTGDVATNLTVSADGTTVAAVNRDEDHAVIYRTSDGEKIAERSFDGLSMPVAVNDIFADPEDAVLALNPDGSQLAVSFSNGGLMILDLYDPDEDLIIYEESDYRHFEGGFCGKYFAFSAEKSWEAQFGLVDTEKAVYVGGYASQDAILLQADERGFHLASGNLLVYLDPDTQKQTELAYTDSVKITAFSVGEEYVLVATDDDCFSFYDGGANLSSTESGNENYNFVTMTERYAILGNRNTPFLRVLMLENHSESQLLSYDARYGHDEARISRDGTTIMFFNYRNFRIYDRNGNNLAEVELPDAENIYDQQFVKAEEDSWLEVIWYDGTVRRYSAENGVLFSEEAEEAPSKDLYEEFYVDGYRIASSLHAAPEVYDIKSGRLVATLEDNSYLTYVTQAGDYIITEYISAEGKRYDILLDQRFQPLAYLPGLCDVVGGNLVFDYKSGNLRQSRIYSLQELMALGEAYLQNRTF